MADLKGGLQPVLRQTPWLGTHCRVTHQDVKRPTKTNVQRDINMIQNIIRLRALLTSHACRHKRDKIRMSLISYTKIKVCDLFDVPKTQDKVLRCVKHNDSAAVL